MSDARKDLASLICGAILLNETIGKAVVEVDELDGTVNLKGIVLSQEAKVAAEIVAQKQIGVFKVVNQLVVHVRLEEDNYFAS